MEAGQLTRQVQTKTGTLDGGRVRVDDATDVLSVRYRSPTFAPTVLKGQRTFVLVLPLSNQ